jgi:hypothetical protein
MENRKLAAASAVTLASVLVALTGSVSADSSMSSHDNNGRGFPDFSRIRQGFEIAPVPLDLRRKNRALVGLGSYIVNAQGGCNDCHTAPPYAEGGNPFLGEPTVVNAAVYLAGGTPFGPTIVSRNITPDENGLPAGLTREEFINTLRTGHDPDEPDQILQVMPWPVFAPAP